MKDERKKLDLKKLFEQYGVVIAPDCCKEIIFTKERKQK